MNSLHRVFGFLGLCPATLFLASFTHDQAMSAIVRWSTLSEVAANEVMGMALGTIATLVVVAVQYVLIAAAREED